jgi:hypothetical protein
MKPLTPRTLGPLEQTRTSPAKTDVLSTNCVIFERLIMHPFGVPRQSRRHAHARVYDILAGKGADTGLSQGICILRGLQKEHANSRGVALKCDFVNGEARRAAGQWARPIQFRPFGPQAAMSGPTDELIAGQSCRLTVELGGASGSFTFMVVPLQLE